MPFKKKDTYKPVFMEPETEQTDESPERKGEAGRIPAGVTKQRHKLSQITTDSDVLDVWERRMLNPDGESMPSIRITTPGMKLRWINLKNPGRYQRARWQQGWVPVEKGELKDEREIFGVSYSTEGFVYRGERQSEMLMKIPTAVWKKIQEKRAELNKDSYRRLKDQMISAGSQHVSDKMSAAYGDAVGRTAGDQAATGAAQFKGSISFGEEKVSSDEAGGFE